MQMFCIKPLLAGLLATTLFVINQAIAQDPLDFDEVRVVAPFEPSIPDAFKISDSPEIKDTIEFDRELVYSIRPIKLKTSFEVEPISPARMSGEPLARIYNGHVRGGFGTHSTPYGELFYNSLRSNEYAYGLRLKHLSSKGNVKNYPHSGYSDNLVQMNAKRFFTNHTLQAGVDYQSNLVHYYGTQKELFLEDSLIYPQFEQLTHKDSISQQYQMVNANIGFKNNKLDPSAFSYDLDLKYNYLMDDYDVSQHNLNFSGSLKQKLPSDQMGLSENQYLEADIDAKHFENMTVQDSLSATVISITPKLSSDYKEFEFFIGLNATMQSDSVNSFKLHPIARTEINLIDGALKAYAYLTGGINRHNLLDFSRQNPFLNTNSLEYRFMNTKSEMGGGFKGAISSYVSYDISISNSSIEDHPFFVTDFSTDLYNKMVVMYDDANIFNFRAEIFSQISEKLQARFTSNYYNYTLENEDKPWHMPSMELSLSVNYNIQDKIIFTADAFARNSYYGKNQEGESEKIHGFHVDTNFGIEYRYTKHLSVFLDFNNVQNQPLERWLNYPSQRFNFLGGVSFSF